MYIKRVGCAPAAHHSVLPVEHRSPAHSLFASYLLHRRPQRRFYDFSVPAAMNVNPADNLAANANDSINASDANANNSTIVDDSLRDSPNTDDGTNDNAEGPEDPADANLLALARRLEALRMMAP